MEICLNGLSRNVEENVTLKELLEQEGYRMERIAVEKNGEIIPKSRYAEILLHSGDIIEVVSFVGGG
ncbi:sulfur carrier protein ThiS [Faecalicatena contorta]|uniref:sulfur carrier protein ThiS n=1 Tax=Faecalicatena contorta TaxID=39482 RepID=UPI001F36651D|nr:sulfur carrier protein ThiS [Faecalicatena contorta]MCF2554050.1 sulfur carrier protein ThiS [Faecalicatena contorta]